jgi:hypothetical protein
VKKEKTESGAGKQNKKQKTQQKKRGGETEGTERSGKETRSRAWSGKRGAGEKSRVWNGKKVRAECGAGSRSILRRVKQEHSVQREAGAE